MYAWMRPCSAPPGGRRRCPCALSSEEGPYQDQPPLCPFRLLPLLIYSGSAIAFLKFQGPKSKNIENRQYNPPSTLNSNQIPQIRQKPDSQCNPRCGLPFRTPVFPRWRACTRIAPRKKALKLAYEHK